MELKQFVSTTLVAVVEGVVDAQSKCQEAATGAHINPGGLLRTTSSISQDAIWDNSENNFARTVSFDVAVTVEDGSKTDAKVGVLSGFLSLGAGGESSNKQLAVNRVQFSVPVLFPTSRLPSSARSTRK